MTNWSSEIRALEKLHPTIRTYHPQLNSELTRLLKTDDENIVLVYARRCLEIIISELCECELKRTRGSEPLKRIIDKLNREEIVPSHIIGSMNNINSISTFGAHPKEYDPEQVKPVLLDLATTLKWYLRYRGHQDAESATIDSISEEAAGEEAAGEEVDPKGSTSPPSHNLPLQLTRFIGREKETKELNSLVENNRLVTITGSGGCGKTRISLQIAREYLDKFQDGVWFIDLSPLEDPELIPRELANTLSITEEPGKPITSTLKEQIRDKKCLLLLDNCEHLVDATKELAHQLLSGSPDIKVLPTSREALKISGEVLWRVPSLTLPEKEDQVDLEKLEHSEAIRLFLDRARTKDPEFTLDEKNGLTISQICHHLYGIPLAIEMAASSIRHMDSKMILERITHRFQLLSSDERTSTSRQKTLKATIDWGYELLSDKEKLLFSRLSVFAGDFSAEGAEEICSDEKLDKAEPLFEEALPEFIRFDMKRDIGIARHVHADCALLRKEYSESFRRYKTALKAIMQAKDYAQAFFELQGIAMSLAGAGLLKDGLMLNGIVLFMHKQYGIFLEEESWPAFWQHCINETIGQAKKEVGEELALQYAEEGIAMGFERAVEYALNFKLGERGD